MLLVISPFPEDYTFVRNTIAEEACPVSAALTAREGLAMLRRNPARVVISERDLPDGDWRAVLEALPHVPERPRLIVTSRHADDRLWAEVLNLGGYDVLPKPFDRQELSRVLHLAGAQPQYAKSCAAGQWALSYG